MLLSMGLDTRRYMSILQLLDDRAWACMHHEASSSTRTSEMIGDSKDEDCFIATKGVQRHCQKCF